MTSRQQADGFVLVGVIMFILALSILGMSLYAVSGYEASFLGQSHNSAAALYAAESGIDMVRERLSLSPAPALSASHEVEGPHDDYRIVRATAWQIRPTGPDSTSTINYRDSVLILVTAEVNGVGRQVKAAYVPRPRNDFYKRLATVSDYFSANSPLGTPLGCSSLSGEIWDGGDATGDSTTIVAVRHDPWLPGPGGFMKRGAVALPDIDGYFAGHPPAQAAPMDTATYAWPGVWSIIMNGGVPGTCYYNPRDIGMFHPFASLNITVTGTAIWELPHGLYVMERASISGNGTLVIVAHQNDMSSIYTILGLVPALPYLLDLADADTGIYFAGGVDVANTVNVILVSDARIKIEHFANAAVNAPAFARAQHLASYGRSFDCYGPSPLLSNQLQYLGYDHTMDSVIDRLYMADLLPHPMTAVENSFAMIRGSWQDLTP